VGSPLMIVRAVVIDQSRQGRQIMTGYRKYALYALITVLALALSAPLMAQREAPTRSVKGLVTDQTEAPLAGAVVQLKNTKTLQVKSFIADDKGSYYFHGLDPNVDYELKAQYEGVASRTRTVSSFDDRREVIYNFELEVPK
jgi:hypothetical protein